MSGWFRPTVRLRLTLLYALLFFVVGALMLVVLYAILSQQLRPPREGPPGPNAGPVASDDAGDGQQGGPFTQGQIDAQVFQARREERRDALGRVPRAAIAALLVGTVAVLVVAWVVSGRMLGPIRQITRHARHASESTLSDRIALRGPPDELKELADTIDAMLARLEAAFRAQRDFSAHASHELRTPLAIIQAEADVALAAPDGSPRERALATAVRDAAVRSEGLVDGLLTLSRSESQLADRTRLDLADLAGDIAGDVIDEADRRGVTIDLELDTAPVLGDRTLLGRMIGNLLVNAIRYNRPSGWVRLSVARGAGPGGGEVAAVTVENSGPAIAPGDVGELFRPFRRGASSRQAPDRPQGYGLGLAIVRSVAAAHGGEVTATPGREGGLRVTVTVPILTDPDGSAVGR